MTTKRAVQLTEDEGAFIARVLRSYGHDNHSVQTLDLANRIEADTRPVCTCTWFDGPDPDCTAKTHPALEKL